MSGWSAALFSRIIIWEERLSRFHWFAQVHPISLKVVIKKHEALPFFSWNLLAERRQAFQFHSLQNTQVFIALYFLLSNSQQEAGLMTSMFAAPAHNAARLLDVCCQWSLSTNQTALFLAGAQLSGECTPSVMHSAALLSGSARFNDAASRCCFKTRTQR